MRKASLDANHDRNAGYRKSPRNGSAIGDQKVAFWGLKNRKNRFLSLRNCDLRRLWRLLTDRITRSTVLKLRQESQVVLPEQADVVDRVFEHQHSLRAHAEREAGDDVGVVAAVA